VFLYVQQNSDDFQMFLPSAQYRQKFYELIKEMTGDEEGKLIDLESYSISDQMNVCFFYKIVNCNDIYQNRFIFSMNTNWMK